MSPSGLALILLLSVVISSCGNGVRYSDSTVTAIPALPLPDNSQPMKAISDLTGSLQCMDRMLADSGTSTMLLSLYEYGETSDAITGLEDMLITTLSIMSQSSKALRYVAQNSADSTYYEHANKSKFVVPKYFIRMSSPQFKSRHSGSINSSRISLDMNMGEVDTLQFMPGVFSKNSITARSSSDQQDKFKVIRTLIELGAIELIGKHTQLPYWQCLDNSVDREHTNSTENTNTPVPTLKLASARGEGREEYQFGERVQLTLSSTTAIDVYCYYQQYNGTVYQIFPNPYRTNNRLQANQLIEIPGDSRISITTDSPGPIENIQCVGHQKPVEKDLDAAMRNPGFEKLPFPSLAAVLNQHLSANDSLVYSDIYAITRN